MKRLRRDLLLVLLCACLAAWLWVEWEGYSFKEEPYTLIEDQLYAGTSVSEPPPGSEAVLNLCDCEDPYQAEVHLQGVAPEGSKPPDLAWLRRMVEFIDTQRAEGKQVFVHCSAGVNRTALVVVGYLMYAHGWTRDRALRYARSRRPQLQPNIEFLRLLSEWEDVLRKEGRLHPQEREDRHRFREGRPSSVPETPLRATPARYPPTSGTLPPGRWVRNPPFGGMPAPSAADSYHNAVAAVPAPR